MGQFTKIERDLKAGITETITVSGSFIYMTKAVGFIKVDLYNRNRADVSEVIMQEGFTWSEDPNLLNNFTSVIINSPIDQRVSFLAGFGRITNESVTIKTTAGVPLDVRVVDSTMKMPIIVSNIDISNLYKKPDVTVVNENVFIIKSRIEKYNRILLISPYSLYVRVNPDQFGKRLYKPTTNVVIPAFINGDVFGNALVGNVRTFNIDVYMWLEE